MLAVLLELLADFFPFLLAVFDLPVFEIKINGQKQAAFKKQERREKDPLPYAVHSDVVVLIRRDIYEGIICFFAAGRVLRVGIRPTIGLHGAGT